MTFQTTVLGRVCRRAVNACLYEGERLYYSRACRRPRKPCPDVRRRPLLGAGRQPEEVATAYRALFPAGVDSKIRRADALRDHIFDLLGSGPTRLTPAAGRIYQPIDWHTDFKSGYRWDPAGFFRDCRYGARDGVDVKVPWELSRFQHLNTLGQAYLLTHDRRYPAEFVDEVEDWIRSNPVGFGVNWACTMDAAIRATSWLMALEFFAASPAAGPHFQYRLYSSIHEHGRFIYHHLERAGQKANHYLADVVGLLCIAVCCPFFPDSPRWLRFGIREVIREMQSQVYDDGCHFEASTCYHRLALELFFFATVLVAFRESGPEDDGYRRVAERVLGAEYVESLHRMFVALLHLLKPDGRMPQIGDNDSGRFQVLGDREDDLDMRYLLGLGAGFFDDPQLKVNEYGFTEDALWLFGPRGYDTWRSLEGRSATTIVSRSFPKAGWHVIRRDADYGLVSCGGNGPEGHAHNDKLSIEMTWGGRDVIVDPGTYVYTPYPRDRNRFRSTAYHNTMTIDGHEQSGPLDGEIFRLSRPPTLHRARLTEIAGQTCFQGKIEYAGIVHQRTVSLDHASRRWVIDDRMSCPRPVAGEVIFHLSPRVESRNGRILDRATGTLLGHFEARGGRVETRTYDYSPRYGVRVEAQCICARTGDPACTAAITTTFVPQTANVACPLNEAAS